MRPDVNGYIFFIRARKETEIQQMQQQTEKLGSECCLNDARLCRGKLSP
jgi:hypothetical protein